MLFYEHYSKDCFHCFDLRVSRLKVPFILVSEHEPQYVLCETFAFDSLFRYPSDCDRKRAIFIENELFSSN